MNDGLSDDITKKFMLPLTIELEDHKEKMFHNAPVSPKLTYQNETSNTTYEVVH